MSFDLHGLSGNEFHVSVWGWAPLLQLVNQVNAEDALGLNLRGWEYNDGRVLHLESECVALAAALEKFADPNRKFRCESTLMRVDEASGRVLRDDEPGGVSPYRIDGPKLIEFIAFLRKCGGAFKIH
jgi:hypothetical protein